MQIFKGVASGKQSFREHCATKWLLEANPRNISASKISRYTQLSDFQVYRYWNKPIMYLQELHRAL